ncbi:hypothetical protein RJ640_019335 [Escallonia rubra]|uniref:Uncharacterized protein n=1 Tax=Escallonia rubra TaxID=112253 RepID=A0AA88S9P7_9ASTE|nr:hypothetical protein RJ640_019335 [Escallonia rubra]
MVERSLASTSDISVLVDTEVILLPDLISTLDHVYKLDHDWLLVVSTRNVSNFPFQLDVDGKQWLIVDNKRIRTEKGILSGKADLQQWLTVDNKRIRTEKICNLVACEEVDRVERHETLAQWRARLDSTRFGSVHLGSNAFKQASMLLALFAGGDGYRVEEHDGVGIGSCFNLDDSKVNLQRFGGRNAKG